MKDRFVCFDRFYPDLFTVQRQPHFSGICVHLDRCLCTLKAMPSPTVQSVGKLPCARDRRFLRVIERTNADIRRFAKSPNNLHKCHLCKREPGYVNHALPRKQRQSGIGRIIPTHAGLAEIIPCSPNEIADELRVFLYTCPIIRQIAAHGFRAEHQAIRIFVCVNIVT